MFNIFKYFIAVVAIATVVGLVKSQFLQQREKPSAATLVVGLQSGYPPFEFRDGDGNIVGFDVDVASRIAAELGKTVVLEDMEFEGEILALKQGKVDLIMNGINITPSRLKEIHMVPYHGEAATHLSLIFWHEIPPGIQSLEDVANHPNPS